MNRRTFALAVLAVAASSSATFAAPYVDPRQDLYPAIAANRHFAGEAPDPACHAAKLVATGGAYPRDRHTLAVRWVGVANYELVYDRHIILLDAYYDRGAIWPALGFTAADVTRADVILLGHAHFDHMSDAASVGARTHATVLGAPVTTEELATQPIPPSQIRTVTGTDGAVLRFKGFTVEPILGRHGEPSKDTAGKVEATLNSLLPKETPEEKAEQDSIQARGTFDPRVIAEGTIAYLITFDDGFRVIYRDSGGKVTEWERKAMARGARVDLAIVAVSADYLTAPTVAQAMEYLHAYKPDVYMPAHHDAPAMGHGPVWRPTEPLFQAMKDEDPKLITISREYREPTCFDTEYNLSRKK